MRSLNEKEFGGTEDGDIEVAQGDIGAPTGDMRAAVDLGDPKVAAPYSI